MGYTPTDWKKRIVDTPDKYTLVDLGGGLFTITPSEGAVTQEGTPLTEANLNHLETQYDEAGTDLTAHKTNATPPGVHRWTAGKLLKGTGADADPTEIDVPASGLALFGDGSDGDVTITTDTTLSHDMFYNNLTINSGITLKPNGYRIFVKGTLTNNGIISGDGNDGGTANPFPGGAELPAGSLGIGAKGGDGGGAGSAASSSLGGVGGDGGTPTSYAAGAATPPVTGIGGFKAIPFAIILKEIETTVNKINGGSGGGGGADTSFGGAGGGGARVLVIVAKDIVNTSGIIRANGGNGSNAIVGDRAGGGGGGGGVIVLVYNSIALGTETANGGTSGNGSGTGGAGVAGSAGMVIKIENA